MAHPTQKYLRELRENPDPKLVAFVEALEPGVEYNTRQLWLSYNGRTGFCSDHFTFRHALKSAGMEHVVPGRKMRRAPSEP